MNRGASLDINFNQLKISASYREKVCKLLYSNQKIKKQIFSFINSQSYIVEPNEIYQEAIVRFFQKVVTEDNIPNIENTEHYILGIAKNIFYSLLKEKEKEKTALIEVNQMEPALGAEKIDAKIIVTKIMKLASESCRHVLMLWASKHKMSAIADIMGYKSEMMARKKKHECLQRLVQYFKNNPLERDQILEYE